MSKPSGRDIRVEVGTDQVAFHTGRRNGPELATILGRETVGEVEVIYLDRLVHEINESQLGGWEVAGAISSILSRPLTGPL